MSETHQHPSGPQHGDSIHLPAGTAWPIVLAFGCTLLLGGILLGLPISLLGLVLVVCACVGWFRQLYPQEHALHIPVEIQPIVVETTRATVDRYQLAEPLPITMEPGTANPIAAGFKAAVLGGIVMAIVAIVYGFVAHHSVWYAINLLGGAGTANWTNPTTADISAFHIQGLIIAVVLHTVLMLLVGLIYGAVLPMLPRFNLILGGIVAPIVWTGIVHSALGLMDPTFDACISWPWFIASQIAFGLVATWIVMSDESFRRTRKLPLAIRAGLEIPGIMHENTGHTEDKH